MTDEPELVLTKPWVFWPIVLGLPAVVGVGIVFGLEPYQIVLGVLVPHIPMAYAEWQREAPA